MITALTPLGPITGVDHADAIGAFGSVACRPGQSSIARVVADDQFAALGRASGEPAGLADRQP